MRLSKRLAVTSPQSRLVPCRFVWSPAARFSGGTTPRGKRLCELIAKAINQWQRETGCQFASIKIEEAPDHHGFIAPEITWGE